MATATDSQVGIRKWLNDQGYKDEDIGYENGRVTLKGQGLINATPQAQDDLAHGLYKDSTYASVSDLQSALKNYQNTYGKPVSSATSAPDRTAMLDTTLNNVYNTVNTQQPYQFKSSTPAFEFKQQQGPFTYDPNNDQAYQAALRTAQSNIQQSQDNTLANLLAHGQGNSSYTTTVAQQIANKEMGNVSNSILPQLIQQAYQRYQDQNNNDYRNQAANYGVLRDNANDDYRNQVANYGVQQDQLHNQSALASALNGMNQQEIQNQRQAMLDRINLADTLSQRYGVNVEPKMDNSLVYAQVAGLTPLDMQQFLQQKAAQDAGYTGIYNDQPTLQARQAFASMANASADNARADAASARAAAADQRAADLQRQNALFEIWQRTGVAPEGIPGVAAGTPLYDRTASNKQPENFTLNDYKGYINTNFYNTVPVDDPLAPPGTTKKVFDSAGARKYIIGLNLSDDQTDQLLKLYGLPTN